MGKEGIIKMGSKDQAMKTSILLFAVTLMVTAPCGAVTLSIGRETASPGDEVNLPVSVLPGDQITGFRFEIVYDPNVLEFNEFSLSSDAESNEIEADVDDSWGRVEVEAYSDFIDELEEIDELGSLDFEVLPSAPYGSTQVRFSGGAEVEIYYDFQNVSTSDGTITVVRPGDDIPSGEPPELTLSMASPALISYGEQAVLHYQLQVRGEDWDGFPSDAYIGVGLPNGRFFYVDRSIRLTTSRTSIKNGLLIDSLSGYINFGAVPGGAPLGRYEFFGVLTLINGDPLSDTDRITDLATTHFDLIVNAVSGF